MPDGEAIGRAELLARFLDDEELLSEVVTRFLAQLPSDLDAMRAAWAASDVAALHRRVHQLQGSLGLFGPGAAYASVSRLASITRDGALSGVAAELDVLATLLGQLAAELRRLVPPPPLPLDPDTPVDGSR